MSVFNHQNAASFTGCVTVQTCTSELETILGHRTARVPSQFGIRHKLPNSIV